MPVGVLCSQNKVTRNVGVDTRSSDPELRNKNCRKRICCRQFINRHCLAFLAPREAGAPNVQGGLHTEQEDASTGRGRHDDFGDPRKMHQLILSKAAAAVLCDSHMIAGVCDVCDHWREQPIRPATRFTSKPRSRAYCPLGSNPREREVPTRGTACHRWLAAGHTRLITRGCSPSAYRFHRGLRTDRTQRLPHSHHGVSRALPPITHRIASSINF